MHTCTHASPPPPHSNVPIITRRRRTRGVPKARYSTSARKKEEGTTVLLRLLCSFVRVCVCASDRTTDISKTPPPTHTHTNENNNRETHHHHRRDTAHKEEGELLKQHNGTSRLPRSFLLPGVCIHHRDNTETEPVMSRTSTEGCGEQHMAGFFFWGARCTTFPSLLPLPSPLLHVLCRLHTGLLTVCVCTCVAEHQACEGGIGGPRVVLLSSRIVSANA
jgi:hypothetical protein